MGLYLCQYSLGTEPIGLGLPDHLRSGGDPRQGELVILEKRRVRGVDVTDKERE